MHMLCCTFTATAMANISLLKALPATSALMVLTDALLDELVCGSMQTRHSYPRIMHMHGVLLFKLTNSH